MDEAVGTTEGVKVKAGGTAAEQHTILQQRQPQHLRIQNSNINDNGQGETVLFLQCSQAFVGKCPQRTCSTFQGKGHGVENCTIQTTLLATAGPNQDFVTHALLGTVRTGESGFKVGFGVGGRKSTSKARTGRGLNRGQWGDRAHNTVN